MIDISAVCEALEVILWLLVSAGMEVLIRISIAGLRISETVGKVAPNGKLKP